MIYNYILLFIIYSMIGWAMEVVVTLIGQHKFVNRGFLIGPYCPVYGFGGIFITLFLSKYKDDFFVFFVMTLFICTILEYFTSWAMEKIFHARWWDYSYKKIHINGRVCLDAMFGFGIVGTVVMYLLNPLLMKWIAMAPHILIKIVSITLATIFITDCIVSLKVMSNLKHINFAKRDNTEEITKKVKETLSHKNLFTKRLVEAFPNFEILKKKTKETIAKTKKEFRKKKREISKLKRSILKKEKELVKMNKKGSK